ncbi:MAG: DUF4365 domain-containing protein [Faecalibacterium sp.]|nr:DUF4365 domain-containing protein [Ruminococcus sp.]MCM1392787.1 DUF4365 domain-containing protein [Ruminococcus sp.]MCM1485519.1 DUF4365 domain-containing protein [Faecalibacterium sp.]
MDIEQLATSAIESCISKVDKLKAFVGSNEKGPSFDGYIGMFSSNNFSKTNFKRINIQVKGKLVKKIPEKAKFPISIADLNNYRNHNGVIFFVVYLDENGETLGIYYASLLPFNINKYLICKENRKTISVSLKAFPLNNNAKFELLLNFYADSQKQSSFANLEPIDLESLQKSGNLESLSISYTSLNTNKEDKIVPFFIEGKELYIYAKTKGNPLPIPIQHIYEVDHIEGNDTINEPIFVKNKKYYDSYKITFLKDKTIIVIGNSFTLTFDNQKKKLNYKIRIKGTLSNRINDLKFVIAVLKNDGFKFGKDDFPINANDIKNKEKHLGFLEEQLESSNEVLRLLELLNVKKDLDIDKCSDEDFRKLDILVKSFLHNEPITDFKDEPPIVAIYRISNIVLLLFFIQEENGIRLYDFFQKHCNVIAKDKTGNEYEVSQFDTLNKKLILESDNIDYFSIVNDFKSKLPSEVLLEFANNVMIQMLLAYDECKEKELLDAIIEMSNWICENPKYFTKEVSAVNQLQIFARTRRLTLEEKEELINIHKTTESDELKVGCLLLIKEIDEAEELLNSFPEDEQKAFKTYPIWYFANEKQNALFYTKASLLSDSSE